MKVVQATIFSGGSSFSNSRSLASLVRKSFSAPEPYQPSFASRRKTLGTSQLFANTLVLRPSMILMHSLGFLPWLRAKATTAPVPEPTNTWKMLVTLDLGLFILCSAEWIFLMTLRPRLADSSSRCRGLQHL